MSVFRPVKLACPSCKAPVNFQAVLSVNADRRPDLRTAIVEGSFQREPCPKCGLYFRLEPEFVYFEIGRSQWILVRPAAAREQWPDLESQARNLFANAFGANAPAFLRAQTAAIKPRVVFGWAALREKILCAELGLSDSALELVKLATIRGLDNTPFRDDTELRLVNVEGDELVLAWIRTVPEDLVETLRIPRELYEEIRTDANGWSALRTDLENSYFTDFFKLLYPAEDAAAEADASVESEAGKTSARSKNKKASTPSKSKKPSKGKK